jgi:hypothetical protein
MPNFVVVEFYLLLLRLFGDGEGKGWNRLLHGGNVEDQGNNFGVSIFIDMTTWRLLFPDGDIKAEMMWSLWNNFLRSLLHFVMVRSGHDEGLGRIIFRSVFLILWWQKEDTRKKKFLNSAYRNVGRRSFGHLFSGHLSSVCLCGHPHCKASNRLGFELCYSQRGYYFVI